MRKTHGQAGAQHLVPWRTRAKCLVQSPGEKISTLAVIQAANLLRSGERLASPTSGDFSAAWTSAVETLETARTTFDAEVPAGPDANEIGQSRWDAYFTAWSHLIDLPAPDVEATAYKIRAYINLAHEEAADDSADNVETLQRLWGETAVDSAFGIVRLLRDACLQAGIDHPVTTMTNDA